MSASCRDMFGKVGLVSVSVRRGRLSVGTCSSRTGSNRYEFAEVGLVSGRVRRVGLVSGRVLRGRLSVGTCPERLAYRRDLFGDVGLLSGIVR